MTLTAREVAIMFIPSRLLHPARSQHLLAYLDTHGLELTLLELDQERRRRRDIRAAAAARDSDEQTPAHSSEQPPVTAPRGGAHAQTEPPQAP